MKSAATQIAEARAAEAGRVIDALPLFRNQKAVAAARIESINPLAGHESIMVTIPGVDGLQRIPVDEMWLQRFPVQPGGYFVTYGDGFPWYVPADLFHQAYAPVGYGLEEYLHGWCASRQVEGYSPEMTADQAAALIGPERAQQVTLQFIAAKVRML